MLRTTLAGLRLHKGRLFTTALAIVLGVMFVTGTLVFTDTLRHSFSTQVMGSADRLDTIVLPSHEGLEQGEEPAAITEDLLGEVRDLPEVAAAQGVTMGDAPLLDADGRAIGYVPTSGRSVGGDVARYEAAEGRLPENGEEVALATSTARQSGFAVGDEVEVLDPEGEPRAFTVVGLIDFGLDPEASYRGVIAFDPETAQAMTGVADFGEIDVIGTEGTPATEVEAAVAAAVGDAYTTMTGEELAEENAANAGTQADIMAMALLLFAAVAVFVGALVIYNTFAILIAQRRRETALLRCAGATRAQVFRGVLTEALVTGLLSSALGVAAGVGLGIVGYRLGAGQMDSQAAAETALRTDVLITPTTIVVGMVVGTVVTLVSATVPALRATRVPPLAALRDSAVADAGKGVGKVGIAVATLLVLASAAMLVHALRNEPSQLGMILVVASGLVAFVAVVLLGPLLVRGFVRLAEVPLRRTGVAGMLAAGNARRSPRRAATAMIALTVGATLITGYSVIAESMERTLTRQLEEQFPVDYLLRTQYTEEEQGVPASVRRELADAPEVATIFSERRAQAEHGDEAVDVLAYPGAKLGEDIGGEEAEGDFADVGPGSVALARATSERLGVGLDDTLSLTTEQGERDYRVAVIADDMGMLPGLTMDERDFAAAFPEATTDSTVFVKGTDASSAAEIRAAVDAAIADHPTVLVEGAAEVKEQFTTTLDTAFLAISALLGLAILIAVFGVANTMALSVLERTRESALLRALGLSRGQLRRMIGVEAVLVCVTGALVGIGLGVLFGWAAGKATLMGLVFALPVGRIALFVGIAALAGLVSAILPARRAARASITASLAAE
ncbi:ABC transporter permease [Marinactinospora endophytica]